MSLRTYGGLFYSRYYISFCNNFKIDSIFCYTLGVKKDDVVSILITLVVGLFLGSYLYVGFFAPRFSVTETSSVQTLDSLTIESEAYGSCGSRCPSFQVIADGTYRFLYYPQGSDTSVIDDGILPLDTQRVD